MSASNGGLYLVKQFARVFCAALAFVLMTFAAPLAIQAQSTTAGTGSITGRVLNQATGKYLTNAVVTVEGTSIEAVTDDNGNYRLFNVPAGDVRITASYVDLDKTTKPVTVAAGTAATVDFELTAQVYQLEKFVVAGDREGSARATQEQRMSASQKAIYAADSFGNVVDSNIGELMKNLPGVTIDYSGEDAGAMRIRGMDPELSNITLDGNEVASVSSGLGGTDEQDTRAFNLQTQSLQNVESIEIKIAPTAEDSANAMGGSVNIKSKSALNQKGRRISFSANMSLNTSELDFDKTPGGGRTPDYKIMPGFSFGWMEAFGKKRPLGVAFNVGFNRAYRYNNKYELPGDSSSSKSGYKYDLADLALTGNRVTPETGGLVPALLWTENGKSTQNRMISLNLDYKLSRNTILFLYSSYNDVKGLASYSRSMRMTAGGQNADADLYNIVSPTGATVGMTNGINSPNSTNMSFNAGARHTFGRLKLNYGVSYSEGKTDPKPEENYKITYSAQGLGMNVYGLAGNDNGNIVQTTNNGATIVKAGDPGSYLDIANYSHLTLSQNFKYGNDTRRGANFDAEFPVVLNLFRSYVLPLTFKTGARYAEQERKSNLYYRANRLTGSNGNYSFGTASEPKIDQFTDPYFENSWGFDVPIPTWLNPYYVMDYYEAHPNEFYTGETDYTTHWLYRQLREKKSAKEATTAAFAQMTARLLHNLTMIAGVRYEYTKYNSVTPTRESTVDSRGRSIFAATGKYDVVTPTSPYYGLSMEDQIRLLFSDGYKESTFGRLYPNIQFKWEPLKNLNVRLAWTSNVGRPNLQYVMKDTNWLANYMRKEEGNPNLKPQSSVKYDAAVEYYFSKNGSVTLSLFRQDFKDYIVKDGNSRFEIVTHDPSLVPASGFDAYGNEVSYEPDQDEGLWTVTSPTNEGTGRNQGFEFTYKQRLGFIAYWLRNFQLYASFSYADPKSEYMRRLMARPSNATQEVMQEYLMSPKQLTEIPMEGVQKQSATLQLQYTGKRFSGNIRAYWVDRFARSIDRTYIEINYQDAYIRYDLSLNYRINSRWKASFDWRNVTNEGDSRHIFDRTGGYFTSGMVINLGIGANF